MCVHLAVVGRNQHPSNTHSASHCVHRSDSPFTVDLERINGPLIVNELQHEDVQQLLAATAGALRAVFDVVVGRVSAHVARRDTTDEPYH